MAVSSSMRWISGFVAGTALVVGVSAVSAGAERKFLSGYAGTVPPRETDRARTWFDMPAVRRLVARLETGSADVAEAGRALEGSGASIDDLLRVGILRLDGRGRVAIGFAYFTAADMKTIHAVADRAAVELAAAYRDRKPAFDRLLASYSADGVRRDELAFVLIAGISLNWDGLAITRERGLRKPRMVEGKDFRYSFWASEEVPGRDYREFYWGSSTYPLASPGKAAPGAYSFSSFGDPDSDPRMNLPDLAFLAAGDLSAPVRAAAERFGLHDTEEMGQKFRGVLGGAFLRTTADVLFALRRAPLSSDAIGRIGGGDPAPLLGLLQAIGYVGRDGGKFRLTVPVLDDSDGPMLRAVLAASREIQEEWLASHEAALRRELSGLTAIRSGLSFEEIFTQVWHEIFGATTRELAREGVIASARRPGVASPGSFSLLWRQSLYAFVPG